MKKVDVLVIGFDKGLNAFDVVVEVLNLIDSMENKSLKVMKNKNIIDYSTIVPSNGEFMKYIVFAESTDSPLTTEEEIQIKKTIKEELLNPELEGEYLRIKDGTMYYDCMFVRAFEAVENGVEI